MQLTVAIDALGCVCLRVADSVEGLLVEVADYGLEFHPFAQLYLLTCFLQPKQII